MKYLIFLILFCNTSAQAVCLTVTNLSTHKQRILSKFFINTFDRHDTKYQIEIEENSVIIEPMMYGCILDTVEPDSDTYFISCGINLKIAETEDTTNIQNHNQGKYKLTYRRYKGEKKETWVLHKELGIANITVWTKPTQTYSGVVKSCK